MRLLEISATSFKLSRAGVDVAKATAAELVFDGFGAYAYNGVYLSGFYPSASMRQSGNSFVGVVNFGKTFATPPQCVVRLFDVNHSNSRIGDYRGYANDNSGQGVGPVSCQVSTTTLTVTIPFSGNDFPAQIGFSYAAMQT